jgi:hypothetical protein
MSASCCTCTTVTCWLCTNWGAWRLARKALGGVETSQANDVLDLLRVEHSDGVAIGDMHDPTQQLRAADVRRDEE